MKSLQKLIFDITMDGYRLEIWPASVKDRPIRIVIEGHGIRNFRLVTEAELKESNIDNDTQIYKIIEYLYSGIKDEERKSGWMPATEYYP